MIKEVDTATHFLLEILQSCFSLSASEVDLFKIHCREALTQRCKTSWHENLPERGSAFRAVIIRKDCYVDPSLLACLRCLNIDQVRFLSKLPCSLTLWIDPFSVSYRMGEIGTVRYVYQESWNRATPKNPSAASTKQILSCKHQFNSSPFAVEASSTPTSTLSGTP